MKRELPEIEELLREWASYFRDRRRWDHCKSIEHRYLRVAEDFAKEGWGDDEAAPVRVHRFDLLRALKTNEAIMQLNKMQKWAITYYYCYPLLPRVRVLKAMKKYSGRHLSWKVFTEQVEIGRYRIAAILV